MLFRPAAPAVGFQGGGDGGCAPSSFSCAAQPVKINLMHRYSFLRYYTAPRPIALAEMARLAPAQGRAQLGQTLG